MLGNNYKITLTAGVNGALPTAAVEACTMMDSAIGVVTSVLDSDVAFVGSGRTVGVAALVYGTSLATNRVLTGRFNLNPLKA